MEGDIPTGVAKRMPGAKCETLTSSSAAGKATVWASVRVAAAVRVRSQ